MKIKSIDRDEIIPSEGPIQIVPDDCKDSLIELESSTKIESNRALSSDLDLTYSLYLREIGKFDLISPEEEVKLADRIRQGDDEAREIMIKANLRLVVKIARDYEGYGLPLLDLINEGNMGLMKAVERFDPNKGGKLSTYGAWWIKQSIKRALANQSKTIRLPVHLVDKIARMRRASIALQDALGYEPSDEELAEELRISVFKVQEMKRADSPACITGRSVGR